MAGTYFPATTLNAMAEAAATPSTNYYLGTTHGSPGTSGANENSGPGRAAIQFGSPTGGVEASTTSETLTFATAGVADHFVIRTTITGGTYKFGGPLSASLTVPAAAKVAFGVGAITLKTTG